MLSTKQLGEGTKGITGVRGEEEGYGSWVILVYFIIFQKGKTGLWVELTSG